MRAIIAEWCKLYYISYYLPEKLKTNVALKFSQVT